MFTVVRLHIQNVINDRGARLVLKSQDNQMMDGRRKRSGNSSTQFTHTSLVNALGGRLGGQDR